jgi:hypothetical protein
MEDDLDNHGFSLPPGYEESTRKKISDRILNLEEIRDCKNLSDLHGIHFFITPDHYFEETTEVRSVISVLQHDKGTSFVLPEDYFLEKNYTLPSAAKVISFRGLATWAAAALLVLSAGFWIWTAYKPVPQEVDCETLACVERADVLKSGELENLNDDDLLQLINDEEIDKSFDAPNQSAGDTSKGEDGERKPKENA